MKIIIHDNFDRETRNEVLVATGLNEHYAKWIAKLLNDNDPEGQNGPNFYMAVEDDHRLCEFEP